MLKTIYYNYVKSQFFEETYSLLTEILQANINDLHRLNTHTITGICQHLGINTKLNFDNSNYQSLEENLEKLQLDATNGADIDKKQFAF